MQNYRFFCLRGFMKSGTNWLGGLLSSHESVTCIGEFHWHQMVNRVYADELILPHDDYDGYRSKAHGHLEEMIKKCMIDAAQGSGATLIGERTPQTLAPLTLRDVPYVSIIRDGRDVLVSRAFHLYNNPKVHRLFNRFPELQPTLAEFQADPWFFQKNPHQLLSNEVMVRESVSWWRTHLLSDEQTVVDNPDLEVRFVRYEDLHKDTAGERDKLLEFLGVDAAKAAPIEGQLKPGFDQEKPAEFYRKGAVGDWKNYFNDQTKAWFNDVASEQLLKYKYAETTDW